MKTLGIILIFALAPRAEAQYWPSFEYNGSWITLVDIPEMPCCYQAMVLKGAVPKSELELLDFESIDDSRWDFGYFSSRGLRIADSSNQWQETLNWPPTLIDSSGFAQFPSTNEFLILNCEPEKCLLCRRENITDSIFQIEAFGLFQIDVNGAQRMKETVKGYILTVPHMPGWMIQPRSNNSKWEGNDYSTYVNAFLRKRLPEVSFSEKTNVIVEGITPRQQFDFSATADSGPRFVPTNFLGTMEPQRMCKKYVQETYGSNITTLTEPTGGALLRIFGNGQDTCIYIFCDAPTNRLVAFSVVEGPDGRTPKSVRCYGLHREPRTVVIDESALRQIVLPPINLHYVEYFERPVDVAVSSCGRYFDPARDFVYVVDQGNRRVVKLQYEPGLDSLIWFDSFGSDYLRMPTAIDYADYGDSLYENDDIYVTDACLSKLLRISSSGTLETSYGSWGGSLANIGYPTGVAVSTSSLYPNRVYVTDSHNYRVLRYISESDGEIMAEDQLIFSKNPWPMISAVDTDAEGNVYIIDCYNSRIFTVAPSLDYIINVSCKRIPESGGTQLPSDLYIDGHEMQLCEEFEELSGIASFLIVPESKKPDSLSKD